MIARSDHKIPGGKLLRIELEVESGVVLRVFVRGDFFAHPEDAFEAAEAELSGLPVSRLGQAALSAFSRPSLRIFGATPEDIASALVAALAAGKAAGKAGGRAGGGAEGAGATR